MKNESVKVREKFERAVKEFGMLGTPSVLAAFSGGADSSVLLFLLHEYCEKHGVALFAAHVNHSIRGNEALRDRDFCVSVCEKLGVTLFVENADVPALAKKSGKGLEECARDVRYAFFDSLMKEHGIMTLAVAHNADDNLETVLFNMLRGAGTKGLSGIPPARDFSCGTLVRPLIYAKKSEIADFAKENGIEYVTDSTNADTDYTRNRIRGKIVPLLREISPSPEDAAARLSAALRADESFIGKCADELLRRENITDGAAVSLLSSLDDALFFRVIGRMCPSALEYTHVCDVKELVEGAREGSRVSLPGRVCAAIESGRLVFAPEETFEKKECKKFSCELHEGENHIPECNITINVTKTSQGAENVYKNFIHTALPSDRIKGRLYARGREDGDRYTFCGMTRKVKKLFCEKKIPISERERVPVICDGEGIVWIPGFPPRERPEKDEKNLLHIYVIKNEK